MEDRAWEALKAFPDIEPSPQFEQRVWARIEGRQGHVQWWKAWTWTAPRWSPVPWAAAAAAGVLLGIGASQLPFGATPREILQGPMMPVLEIFAPHPPSSLGAVYHQHAGGS